MSVNATLAETCQRWNAQAGYWETVTVQATPEPRRTTRKAVRHGMPRDLAGLSAGAPLPAWWRDTAYAPADGFADMRTYLKPETTRTHRSVVVIPARAASTR